MMAEGGSVWALNLWHVMALCWPHVANLMEQDKS